MLFLRISILIDTQLLLCSYLCWDVALISIYCVQPNSNPNPNLINFWLIKTRLWSSWPNLVFGSKSEMFDDHITNITRTAFYHLKIYRNWLWEVGSCMHFQQIAYYNAIVSGLSKQSAESLRLIQYAAVRVLTHSLHKNIYIFCQYWNHFTGYWYNME